MYLILIPLIALTTPVAVPKGTGHIEAICSGGIAGRTQRVFVGTDGKVSKWTNAAHKSVAGDAAAAKMLWQRLDAIKFDTLASPAPGRPIMDGINCSLSRAGGGRPAHRVSISQRASMGKPSAALREVQAVLSAVLAMGNMVALNPQPIPPKESMK